MNYPSQDTTKTNPSFGKINIYKQITQAKLTRVAAPLGGVFITDDAAVMDLILGAALLVCGQIGQKCRGGTTGDAQFEGGGAGGDAAVQIVHPGGGLEQMGGLVQGHGYVRDGRDDEINERRRTGANFFQTLRGGRVDLGPLGCPSIGSPATARKIHQKQARDVTQKIRWPISAGPLVTTTSDTRSN